LTASITSYALNAGVATLAFSRDSVVKISQMGVELVLQTADGTRHVLQGVALRSMTDTSIRDRH
jgi:hypothetical protein